MTNKTLKKNKQDNTIINEPELNEDKINKFL